MHEITVKDIWKAIDELAPFSTSMGFDNTGLLVGSGDAGVRKGLVVLDITMDAVKRAEELHAELILSHHPVIFTPLKAIRPGEVPYELARRGLAAICAHTNLDMAAEGVNTCLARRLGLRHVRPVREENGLPIVLEGDLQAPMMPLDFIHFVKKMLCCQAVSYTEGKETVSSVAVCSGSGADYLLETSCGAQAYVTGEVRHHEWIEARRRGMTLVAAGHHSTEAVVLVPLAEELRKRFPQVEWIVMDEGAPEQYL